jgi:hypothetical protein
MDIAGILDTFAVTRGIPQEAIAADANREAALPVFLAEIEQFLAADPDARTKPTPLFFIAHLLASWRETSAYRPLARLLHCGDDDIDHAFQGTAVDCCYRIMASVFDGDPQPLYDIVLDPAADELIRARMCDSLAMLVLHGALPLEVRGFLRQAHSALQPEPGNFVWDGWQHAVAVLGLSDLAPLAEQAFDSGHISRGWLEPRHFREDLEWALAHPGEMPPRDVYTLFGDAMAELSVYPELGPEPAAATPPACRQRRRLRDRATSCRSRR